MSAIKRVTGVRASMTRPHRVSDVGGRASRLACPRLRCAPCGIVDVRLDGDDDNHTTTYHLTADVARRRSRLSMTFRRAINPRTLFMYVAYML